MTRTRVAVCGRSIYMAGLAASLKGQPDLEVVTIDPGVTGARDRIDELAPAAIAFDLAEVPTDLALSLLRDHSGLLLIGIDPCRDELLVLSGHSAHAVSTADVVQVIRPSELGGHDHLPGDP